MKLLTRGGRKFLFALQTGKYFGESVLVGMVTGIVVVAFRYGIDLVRHYVMEELGHHRFMSHPAEGRVFNIPALEHFADPHRWLLMVLPAIGAALGYFLIKVFTSVEHARGTGSAIWAYHNRNGYLPATVIPVKGVASLLGVTLAIVPVSALLAFAVFAVVLLISHYVSLGSMIAGCSFPIFVICVERTSIVSLQFFSVVFAILLLVTHRKNISRLRNGEEN